MTEQEYEYLLRATEKFCDYHNIEHLEFVHNIIINTEWREKGLNFFKRKVYYKKSEIKVISIEDWVLVNNSKKLAIYKYCYKCNQVLLETEFEECVGNTCKRCLSEIKIQKGYSKKSQTKRRKELKEGYIIDILKKKGFKKEDITRKMIEEKRVLLLQKRAKKVA